MSAAEPDLLAQVLPDGAELRFPPGEPVTIGRDPDVQLVIDHGDASRRHAVAVAEPGTGWVLMDRSTNGTFLDSQPVGRLVISGPLTVRIGDPDNGVEVRLAPASPRRESGAGGGQGGTAGKGKTGSSGAGGTGTGGTGTGGTGSGGTGRETGTKDAGGNGAAGKTGPWTGTAPELSRLGTLKASRLGLGKFTRAVELPAARIRIGRAADNDVVVPDLLVSRYHAEVRTGSDGRYQVADLGSHNGTYVNGSRLQGRTAVSEGAVITIGHHAFVLSGGRLEEFIDTGSASFAALGLSVRIGTKYLLKDLSFAADGGDFVTVLGPTGAGKSTLIKALSGYRPADSGSVLYNGRDIYANYQELRNRIGYVPQDDVLHPQLTVRSALRYSARLRFPPDVPAGQRDARVEEVIGELGLEGCADVRLSTVSGGQRKRTSIALELLTKPSLLILDEPTSGLDPWYEWTVMELLRKLADGGRTVVAVTHTIESLDLCNRLLFLAPGGQTAYFGPPADSLGYFGAQRYKEIFNQLNHAPAGELAAKFVSSAEDAKYVTAPLAALRAGTPPAEPSTPATSAASPGWASQLATLGRRFTAVIAADRRNTTMLFLQAPILGLLMAAILPTDSLRQTGPPSRGAAQIITALVLGATYLGASNSIREIVKERAILTRERAVGLSPAAYVLSKVILLGLLTVAQSAVLVALGVLRQRGPGAGSVLPDGEIELFLVAAAAGLAAMALGLVISAFVSNADKALTILPVVLFAQFLLTGGLFPVNTPGIQQLSYLASAHWGYAAAASTVDLDRLTEDGCNGALGRVVPGRSARVRDTSVACDGSRAHTAAAWTEDMAILVVLSGVFLAGAAGAVQRIGQPRRVTRQADPARPASAR